MYVGSESVEVFTLQGKAELVSTAGDSKYELSLGSPVITNGSQVMAGTDAIDPQWDGWNMERNNLILTRLEVKGASTVILPQNLKNESYSLEENGVWEEVNSASNNGKQRLWRPTKVEQGWRPFTSGRWVEIYGENCWVPDEPFGYVTHHYGNWEFVNGNWYWAPPSAEPQPEVVAADQPPPPVAILPAWYPGRVGWFYSETEIGWVPLAPQEPFYSVNPWGPMVVMANDGGPVDESPAFAYYDDGGVVVEQNNFYHVENYTAQISHIHDIDPNARTYKNANRLRRRKQWHLTSLVSVPARPPQACQNRRRLLLPGSNKRKQMRLQIVLL